jgi:hypothetical protein
MVLTWAFGSFRIQAHTRVQGRCKHKRPIGILKKNPDDTFCAVTHTVISRNTKVVLLVSDDDDGCQMDD